MATRKGLQEDLQALSQSVAGNCVVLDSAKDGHRFQRRTYISTLRRITPQRGAFLKCVPCRRRDPSHASLGNHKTELQ
jgi:hypothetical protein